MAKITFGRQHFKSPTPPVLRIVFKSIVFLAGLWALIGGMVGVSEVLQAAINKWALIGMAIVRFTIQFFGFDFDPDQNNEAQPDELAQP